MSQDDIEGACRKLILGENKVCGLTHAYQAATAYSAGAVYGGLIFVDTSSRFVDTEQARSIIQGAPLKYVGVFQDEDPELIAYTVKQLGLSVVQLHGDESPKDVKTLRGLLPSKGPKACQIWKAHGVSDALPNFEKFNVDKHLLDTRIGQQTGGTGKVCDWSLLSASNSDKNKILLAGGLNPENAREAALIGVSGLDFNSGVESAPGKKDVDKVNSAFSEIKKYMLRD